MFYYRFILCSHLKPCFKFVSDEIEQLRIFRFLWLHPQIMQVHVYSVFFLLGLNHFMQYKKELWTDFFIVPPVYSTYNIQKEGQSRDNLLTH